MKKLITYILTGILLLFTYACEKQLNELPKNEKVDGNTILDESTAQIALNGAYYRLANISSSDNVTQWGYHEVYPGYLSGYLGYGFGANNMEMNNNSGGLTEFWTECYTGLNAANGVISGVEALPDNKFTSSRKQEILGEARFIRAYHHYRLLMYFSLWYDTNSEFGVLLKDKISTLSNIVKARSSVADSYQFILDDLDYAIANAPETNESYYATKWTAMALKMRVLMNRGTSSDYLESITLADNIIQNGPYVLEENAQDIFYTKGLSSSEVMLGIKPQTNQELYYYNISRQYATGASSFYVAKKALKELLANDPRESWLVGPDNPYAAWGSPDTYYFMKYLPAGSLPTQLSEVAYAFRLTEVYLLKSEAIIRSGGNLEDAKTILRTIQGHAGITDFTAIDNANTSSALLLQNFYETARSLVGEDGQDWMALMRLPMDLVAQVRPSITGKTQFYFPIPQGELQNNPLFGGQNPGYQN